ATEAWLLQGRLQACGVPTLVADDQMAQTYSLLAQAIPARVMVPQRRWAEAEAIRQAWLRGEFALRDDDPDVDARPG
ncbi:MAG: hypothetical protein B7X56_02290, partial [Burkholderiales bacterium 34-67-9]